MPLVNTNFIFQLSNEADFNKMALELYEFQIKNNKVYGDFAEKITKGLVVDHYTKIPFLPIEFFKSHEVVCRKSAALDTVFTSSATTSQTPSKHIVKDVKLYEESFLKGFERFYGKPQDLCILALLPNYLQRTGSSLVYMFDELIRRSGNKQSGFYLDNYEELKKTLEQLKLSKQRTLLIGVTYALLDLAEMGITLNENFVVMETGGMKGKRKELLKEELHAILKAKLGVSKIHSEYGMTELLSQAYSKGDGVFECPPWMKVLIRDIEDPLSFMKEGKTGGINVVDLANVNSCSFIATQDLGKINTNGQFELMGRFDNADIRGCNLMVGF